VLLEQDVTGVNENRGIDGRLAGAAACSQRDAGEDRRGQIARSRRQLVDSTAAAGEKAGLFEEIGGRIATDDQFGEDDKARAMSGGAVGGLENLFQVAGDIPDSGIDLG